MRATELLELTPSGLFCPGGDFHVDPLRPVPRALVTHGHSDHARPGHAAVLATAETLAIMAARLGDDFAGSRQAARLGETLRVGSVDVTFFPAGHVLGSAQILIQSDRCRAVISGDYKRQGDPTCAAFEPVACDVFVTEATFGLPVFSHPSAAGEMRKLLASLALFPDRPHLVGAYALGKAQRVIALAREAGWERPIYIHGALDKLCALYAAQGVALGPLLPARGADKRELAGAIVVAPPGSTADLWSRRLGDPVTAFASGWMRIRARARQRGVELPLVISDHADWAELQETIRETGCSEVWVTHGQEDALVHWCLMQGLAARPLHMLGYGEEEEETAGPGDEPSAA